MIEFLKDIPWKETGSASGLVSLAILLFKGWPRFWIQPGDDAIAKPYSVIVTCHNPGTTPIYITRAWSKCIRGNGKIGIFNASIKDVHGVVRATYNGMHGRYNEMIPAGESRGIKINTIDEGSLHVVILRWDRCDWIPRFKFIFINADRARDLNEIPKP